MAVIVTKDNCVEIDGALIPKNSRTVTKCSNGVLMSQVGENLLIPVSGSTIDGNAVSSVSQLYNYFAEKLFTNGGGSGNGAVNSVLGDIVDNTDPANPIIPTENIEWVIENHLKYRLPNFGIGEYRGTSNTVSFFIGSGLSTYLKSVSPHNANAFNYPIVSDISYNSSTGYLSFDVAEFDGERTFQYNYYTLRTAGGG